MNMLFFIKKIYGTCLTYDFSFHKMNFFLIFQEGQECPLTVFMCVDPI